MLRVWVILPQAEHGSSILTYLVNVSHQHSLSPLCPLQEWPMRRKHFPKHSKYSLAFSYDGIHGQSNIEPALHLWNKPQLFIVHNIFYTFINMLSFSIYERLMCRFLFMHLLVWFGYQSNTASQNELGSIPLSSVSGRDHVELALFFESLENSPVKRSGPADFFFKSF